MLMAVYACPTTLLSAFFTIARNLVTRGTIEEYRPSRGAYVRVPAESSSAEPIEKTTKHNEA